MSPVIVVLLVVAANIDNVSAGFALGLKRKHIGPWAHVLIASAGAAATLIGMLVARPLEGLIPDGQLAASALGSLIFLGIGLETVLMAGLDLWLPPASTTRWHLSSLGLAIHLLRDPALADRDASGRIDVGEASSLAVALGLNNLAVGIGAGLIEAPVVGLTLLTGVASTLALVLGRQLGCGVRLGLREPLARLLSGVLFIALGGFGLVLH